LIPRAAWNTVLDVIATLIKEHREQTHEHEVMLSDGTIGWQQWVNHPIVEPDGTVAEYQAIGRDISDRKRAEEAKRNLAHAARVSTLGALAVSLAHELNQPLTAILSNAQAGSRFLAEPYANVAEVREVLQDIAQDTKRAGDVIRRLRKLVKNDDIHFEALDLNLECARPRAQQVWTRARLGRVPVCIEWKRCCCRGRQHSGRQTRTRSNIHGFALQPGFPFATYRAPTASDVAYTSAKHKAATYRHCR